jgi:hypothetical protein
MKTKDTNQLVADILALSLEVRHHLEDGRRRLTPLQIEALSNAISALANYFTVWKAHELAAGRAVGRRGKRVSLLPAGKRTRHKR